MAFSQIIANLDQTLYIETLDHNKFSLTSVNALYKMQTAATAATTAAGVTATATATRTTVTVTVTSVFPFMYYVHSRQPDGTFKLTSITNSALNM